MALAGCFCFTCSCFRKSFLHWQLKSRFLKNFKPQELDMYVTEEQIKAQMNVRNVEIFQIVCTFFKVEIK